MRKQKSGDLQSPRRMIESDHGTTRDCRVKTTSQSSLRKRKEAESFRREAPTVYGVCRDFLLG